MTRSWAYAASQEFREEANTAKVNFDSMCFVVHDGMGTSKKTGHGDEIERWEGYIVLVGLFQADICLG